MSWPKHLQVDKRIVVLLSASTYENFPKALREAVSNAYDADATRVTIEIDIEKDQITILDNGSGMTPDEFDFYLRIAGRQRDRPRTSASGRTRIGQFGIGFLSVFPFCKTIQVESTVPNSPVVFKATVPSERFTTESAIAEDVAETEVSGFEYNDPDALQRHYTMITLTGLTYFADRYLDPPPGERPADANSIRSWNGMDRLRWELAETLPVSFEQGSHLGSALPESPNPMAVFLNRKQLFRNDYSEEVLTSQEAAAGSVRFNYAIGTPWKAIHPYEGRGLKIRVHGVGVGERTYFDLQIAGKTFSRLHWLTGDIAISGGLDESIALNRDSFTTTQSYDDFREFFRDRLRRMAYDIEAIDVRRRRIHKLAKSDHVPAGNRLGEIIEQAAELKGHGFRVDVVEDTGASKEPAAVDLARRVVTIRPKHPTFSERITIAGKTHPVRYLEWDHARDKFPACRLARNGTIEINASYPPFKSSRLSDVLKRVQVVLLLSEARAHNKDDLFRLTQEGLLKEFSEGDL